MKKLKKLCKKVVSDKVNKKKLYENFNLIYISKITYYKKITCFYIKLFEIFPFKSSKIDLKKSMKNSFFNLI